MLAALCAVGVEVAITPALERGSGRDVRSPQFLLLPETEDVGDKVIRLNA